MKISQRKAGVILSYTSESIKILTGLIYTPIMLRLLGQSEYGLYQLVYSVVSYLSLLSMGFNSSYMRFYSRYKAVEDDENVARLNGMFMTIFLLISIICILCGIVMVSNVTAIFGTGLTEAEIPKARVLMGIMVINLALTFPNSVFTCNTTANEKFLFQKLIIVAQSFFNPFLTLPLLLMGFGSIGMVSITTILTATVLLTNMWYSFKKLKVRFIFKGFKFSLLKEMWVVTVFIFLNRIVDQVNLSVDKFLVGRIMGTTAVAVYGVGSQINLMYFQFSTAVSNVFVPKVNQIVVTSKDDNELTKLVTKVGRIQFIILFLILSGFVLYGQEFIYYWSGKGYAQSYFVALWLMIPCMIPLIQNLGIEVLIAKNKHRVRSIVFSCIAVGNVLWSIFLIGIYGPIGAAMGTAIAVVISNTLFMNWYYHKKIGLNVIYFWKQILKFLSSISISIVLGYLLRYVLPITSFWRLAVDIGIYSGIYCIMMWLLGLNQSEKQLIKRSK